MYPTRRFYKQSVARRHLRCFLAVAEELHFARAAERLHIEQSPLLRAIRELEEELGGVLFAHTTRSTRLTRAGKLFLEHVPRVFAALQQARDSVKAAANGFHGQLRIALSDGVTPSRLPALLALCRQEEPEVEIRLTQVPLAQQIKRLPDDLYDVGLARGCYGDEVGDGVAALPVWSDPLMVAVPARHDLLRPSRDEQRLPDDAPFDKMDRHVSMSTQNAYTVPTLRQKRQRVTAKKRCNPLFCLVANQGGQPTPHERPRKSTRWREESQVFV